MKRIYFLLASVLLIASLEMAAQIIPVNTRFGKVSKEEVELMEYPADTSASALMLYEYTSVSIDFDASGGFKLNTRKHQRIKVLNEEGLDWGDVEMIYYNSNTLRDNISGIDVSTYNLVNGKVVETKMPSKYVFREDFTENYKKLSFSAQEVRVGSVIEIRYTVSSNIYWEIDDIFLQKDIPVNLSECIIRLPEMFEFNKKQLGFNTVKYEYAAESGSLPLGGGSVYSYTVNVDKYSAADIPAFKEEPYLYNADQYYTALHYDIRSLTIPGSVYEDFSVNWGDVDDSYLDSDMMRRFRAQCQFKDEVAALPADGSDMDRIVSAVKLVKGKVAWDKSYKVFPQPLAQVVKAQSGTNADINCLIAGCLREMGYTVEPVMIKLRSSGLLLEHQPEMHPYDTFILKVTAADGTSYYLDGGSDDAYINVLSPLMLVEKARVLRPERMSQWVDLTRLGRNGTIMSVKASVAPDMTLSGTVSSKFSGQDSYSIKRDYNSFDDEDGFIEDIENNTLQEVLEFSQAGMKDYSSNASYEYKFSSDLGPEGDRIYINPFISRFHSKDSFQSIKREYPIDFPYPYMINYMFILEIPEGYAVEQMPENALVKLQGLDATLKLLANVRGQVLQISFSYTQNKMIGLVNDYESIREFWQYINDTYESMIVLKKI